MLFHLDVFEPLNHVDAPTLTHVDWLNDECLRLFLCVVAELILQIGTVGWQLPRLREEVVLILQVLILQHTHKVFSQVVFTSESLNPRHSVYPLPLLYFADLFGLHWSVGPVNIPVGIDVGVQFEFHATADPLDHVVAAVLRAQNQISFRRVFLLLFVF